MKKFKILLLVIVVAAFFTSCSSGLINDGLPNALESGNLECVKEAVEKGADVSQESFLLGPDANPLYYSMRNGQTSIPELLLSQGANPNYVDSAGISLLMYTVGAHKDTGLDYANVEDNENYKTLLNDKRTNINLKGKLSYTALDYACLDNGNLDIVSYLISHGAKVTETTMKCAMEGFSQGFCEASVVKVVFDNLTQQGIPYGIAPEFEAAIQGNSNKLRSIIYSGKITESNKQIIRFLCAAFGDKSDLQLLAGKNVNLEEKFHSDTLLGMACSYGKLDTVKYLVSKHVNLETPLIQIETVQEETALTKAIRHNRIDVVDYLLKNGAEFQTFDDTTQENDLRIACENGSLNLIKFIVDHGYPLTNKQLVDALSAASINSHINVLNYFLNDKKVNINVENNDETILGTAAFGANLNTLQYLVNHGANVNGGKARVMTPLDRAVNCNRADVVKYLIDKGADVNAVGVYSNGGGKTTSLLTQAVQKGYFDIVKLLVEHGANIHYKEGWPGGQDTAIDVANKEGSEHIINYLEKIQKDRT